jgi:hypothetical protein
MRLGPRRFGARTIRCEQTSATGVSRPCEPRSTGHKGTAERLLTYKAEPNSLACRITTDDADPDCFAL